jgi:hypothetical protein
MPIHEAAPTVAVRTNTSTTSVLSSCLDAYADDVDDRATTQLQRAR